MENSSVEDADCRRLYELIWKRTMASQMADAELEKTIAKIRISTNQEDLTAQGEVLKFDGFLKVYMEDRDEEDMTEEEHRRHASSPADRAAAGLQGNESDGAVYASPSPLYGSFPGKKTGRTGHRKAFHLCANHFNRSKKRIC